MSKRYKHGLMLLLLLMGLLSLSVQAHLLNMTKVQIEVNEDGRVRAEVKLDLAREFDGVENYFIISQSTELSALQVQEVLNRLKDSIELTLDQQGLNWHVERVVWPDMDKATFMSDFTWPMTTIYLSSELPESNNLAAEIKVTFADSFLFEEPIAITIEKASTGRKMSRWLVPNQVSPSFALSDSSATLNDDVAWQWDTVKNYIWLGMKHIVPMGLDHVLFVLGLFLGIRNMVNLLKLITTFTIAHSVTLALSAYGAVQVPSSIVEPLIAVSIMWVAVENIIFKQAQKWRLLVVFMFGLLHGLGFAAALRELELPANSFLTALVSFNIGIEFAQIAVVLVAYLIVGWLRNTTLWRKWIVIPASSLIAVVAAYWTLSLIVI